MVQVTLMEKGARDERSVDVADGVAFSVDASNRLTVVTEKGDQAAVFAAGTWDFAVVFTTPAARKSSAKKKAADA